MIVRTKIIGHYSLFVAHYSSFTTHYLKKFVANPIPEMTDIINILLYPQFAYHFKHGLICDSKQYYGMFKITKCEDCVVY